MRSRKHSSVSSLSSVSVGWFILLCLGWLVHILLSVPALSLLSIGALVHILLSVPALSLLSIEALVHILLSVPALSLLSIGSHFLSLASKHLVHIPQCSRTFSP